MDGNKRKSGLNDPHDWRDQRVVYSGPDEYSKSWHDFAKKYANEGLLRSDLVSVGILEKGSKASLGDEVGGLSQIRINALNIMNELAFGNSCIKNILDEHISGDPSINNDRYRILKKDLEELAVALSVSKYCRFVINSLADRWASNVRGGYKGDRVEFVKTDREANLLYSVLTGGSQRYIKYATWKALKKVGNKDVDPDLVDGIFSSAIFCYNPEREATFTTYLVAAIMIALPRRIYERNRSKSRETDSSFAQYMSDSFWDNLSDPGKALDDLVIDRLVFHGNSLNSIFEGARLNGNEKVVLIKRYGLDGYEERKLRAIGDELGVTAERARQIESDAMEKVKKYILKRKVGTKKDGDIGRGR